ncbi:hypothetical protein K3495_g14260 [Podosphaera aphanis]|nr:hypothetical protein K3495_g14260 [Podosphaera aphanis]
MQIFEVSNFMESFIIFHIYHEKSNRDGISQATLQRFYQVKIQVDKPFLLLGDLNLHHQWWNPMIQSPSPQATELHDYSRKKRARLLLDPEVVEEFGGTFHRSNSRSTSIINLAFVASFQTIEWDHWRHGENTRFDHEIILFQSFKFPPPSPSEQGPCLPPRFNTKKANWDSIKRNLSYLEPRFTNTLLQAISGKDADKDADKVAGLLQEIILKAAEDTIPRSKAFSYSKSWWNEELSNLRRQYHSAKRKAKKSWLQDDIESARVKRNHYFRSISHVKRQHWENFLSEAKDKSLFKAYSYSDPKYFIIHLSPPSITCLAKEKR